MFDSSSEQREPCAKETTIHADRIDSVVLCWQQCMCLVQRINVCLMNNCGICGFKKRELKEFDKEESINERKCQQKRVKCTYYILFVVKCNNKFSGLNLVEINAVGTDVIHFHFSCSKGARKYNCPKCNLAYCSVECYKAPEHQKCSEEFYRDCVVEEMSLQSKLQASSAPSDDVKKMYDILQRIEQGDEPMDSDLELSDKELDSDDDADQLDDDDLSKRLEGVDLNDADAIWSKLTESEQQEFNKIIESEDVTSILPKFDAWWEHTVPKHLIAEVGAEEPPFTVEHPKIVDVIGDFARISTKAPAPCVLNNLTNVLAGYASMVRFFYGEHGTSKHEAVNYLIKICANLRTNANFDDQALAIESIRQDSHNEGYSIDERDMRQLKKDVDHLKEGPIQDKITNTFVLAALSDLHHLFSEVKTEQKMAKPKATDTEEPSTKKDDNEEAQKSDTFAQRFSNRKEMSSSHHLEKGKLTAIIKKIEYYLAYAKKYHWTDVCEWN